MYSSLGSGLCHALCPAVRPASLRNTHRRDILLARLGRRLRYTPHFGRVASGPGSRSRPGASAAPPAAGRFLIRNLLPGKYILKVPVPDGTTKDLSVRLSAGQVLLVSPMGSLLKTGAVYAYPNPAGRTAIL